jgi:hypothetical protein
MMASLPPHRQVELRKLITYAFNTETPDDDDDNDNVQQAAHDGKMEFNKENAKLLWVQSTSIWNPSSRSKRNNLQSADGPPTESTSLV